MADVLTPTPDQLVAILADHAQWLRDGTGRGANLNSANLNSANLSGADLHSGNLHSANLHSADLSCADLSGADLSCANLHSADLRCANLSGANLSGADLSGADLRCADLSGANLSGAVGAAMVLARTEILAREGEVVGWKKCFNSTLVKLRVPADAKRSNAPGGRKCRAERVEVLAVIAADGSEKPEAQSIYDEKTIYRVGATVHPHTWGADRLEECAPGIHFYLTREEAESHV